MQERRNPIANALELRLSCTNPSIHIQDTVYQKLTTVVIIPKRNQDLEFWSGIQDLDRIFLKFHNYSWPLHIPRSRGPSCGWCLPRPWPHPSSRGQSEVRGAKLGSHPRHAAPITSKDYRWVRKFSVVFKVAVAWLRMPWHSVGTLASFKALRAWQDGCYFADDIFQLISFCENEFFIWSSLMFIPRGVLTIRQHWFR